jgi:hypothetical protein
MAWVLLTDRMNQKPQSTSAQSQKPQPGARSENRDAPGRIGQSHDREDGHGVTSDARRLASDVGDQMTKSAERQLAGGKDRAAEAISHLAEALRETGGQLRAKEMPVADDYLGRAATQVEGVARYLQNKNLGQVVGDLESFARREPVLFVGGALVVGLLGARFLKSSAPTVEERGFHR